VTDMESLLGDQTPTPAGGRRAEKSRRRGPGCLIALLVLAVLAGAGYWGVSTGIDKIKDQFASADDYPGPGTGQVSFEVKSGDTIAVMGRGLKEKGVVASVEAFIDAAAANPKSDAIQAGYYSLKKEMKASDVVSILVDPGNIVTTSVVIPEGFQVGQIVDRLVKQTGFKKADFEAALQDPKALGLPDYADGNPEGYLFPATYQFGPEEQPADMLKDMVNRWTQAASDNDLVNGAQALGYTPAEVMTMASLVQAEGRGKYMVKISRVLYNRLENPDNGVTNGLLQVDASVNYALHRSGTTAISDADKESVADSPYNTYSHTGLPPTPIEAPGDDAIQAALHPAEGNWLFYVTVNLKTGETKFTDDYDEFLQFKQELRDYCDNESGGAC
jgi:UPF0755 protein